MDNQQAKTAQQWVDELDMLAGRLQEISDSLGPLDVSIIEKAVYKKVMGAVFVMFLVNNLLFLILYIIFH